MMGCIKNIYLCFVKAQRELGWFTLDLFTHRQKLVAFVPNPFKQICIDSHDAVQSIRVSSHVIVQYPS